MSEPNNQIIIFKTDDGKISVNAQFDAETAWLSLDQMAVLFGRDKSTISRHIKNVFLEGELQQESVVAKFATTAADGKTYQTDYVRELDTILRSTKRKLLDNAGKISQPAAQEKARLEYRKYKAKTLDSVEEEYLKTINALEKKAKTENRKNNGTT